MITSSQRLILLCIFFLLNGCVATHNFLGEKKLDKQLNKEAIFIEHFTGLAIFDPQERKWIYQKNAAKYFTPASNTKLLTFFASLKTISDSIPALKYQHVNDTLFFSGTGDPSFLHPDFKRQKIYDFLKKWDDSTQLVYVANSLPLKYGAGWAWDDYTYDFQPELSDLPIYGNVLRIQSIAPSIKASPQIFENLIEIVHDYNYSRDLHYNLFFLDSTKNNSKREIPFITSSALTKQMLSDTLKRKIALKGGKIKNHKILYSGLANNIYNIMLKRSDNFYAEQLLLIGSQIKGFNWNTGRYRKYIIDKHLSDSPQPIIWKDGSGLSRYNLITPMSMVDLLDKIQNEIGFESIKQLFPVGGKSGTIRNWYKADKPYIYAKTGTLSNNHNLSGYIKTQSGKVLIFSFMNNNYVNSNAEIKTSMQRILEYIRDYY